MTVNGAIERLQTLNIVLTDKAGHEEGGIEKIFTFSDITAICTAIQSKCKYWNAEHEDCALNYAEIRNNVIDEFAKKAKEQLEDMGCEAWNKDIDKIAEQMKGGAE